jgi:PAP2 superfamily
MASVEFEPPEPRSSAVAQPMPIGLWNALGRRSGHAEALGRFWTDVLAEIYEDRWLYLGIALHVIAVGALAFAIGDGDRFVPFLYVTNWVRGAATVLLPATLIWTAAKGVIARPAAPLFGWKAELDGIVRPRVVAGFLLFCALVVFYGSFTSAKNLLPEVASFDWDVSLANVDKALFFGQDPVNFLEAHLGAAPTHLIDVLYSRVWFGIMLGVSSWAAVTTRFRHLRYRFYLSCLVCWTLIGNMLAGVFLSGGPIYYANFTGDHLRFAGLASSLAGTDALNYANYLWSVYAENQINLGTGISAFPSIHLGVATLVALYLWSVDRRVGAVALASLPIMVIGAVRLGWHYAIGCYASIIITFLIWQAVGYFLSRGGSSRDAGGA